MWEMEDIIYEISKDVELGNGLKRKYVIIFVNDKKNLK